MTDANIPEVSGVQGLRGLDGLIFEVDKLVSLPDIYYRLETVVVDPTSTTNTIAELLRCDPDLCARMLRVANSAFYSFPTRVETIDLAVTTIGLRQIRELVLATSVIKAFEGIPPGRVNMSTFWEHSVAVAVMARALGKQARLANADSFYIPGLLHDIGRLVMYLKLPELMHYLLQQRDMTDQGMFTQEREILGYSHAEIGARLLESWKVPQSIWEPVANHHTPDDSGEYALVACAIHAADAWVNTNRAGSTGSCFLLEMDPNVLQNMGVASENLHPLGLESGEQMVEIVSQFRSH